MNKKMNIMYFFASSVTVFYRISFLITSIVLHSVVTEECAFAKSKKNSQPGADIPKGTFRRQDVDPSFKFQYGNTYPPGLEPKTTSRWPPRMEYQLFTPQEKPPTRNPFKFVSAVSVTTPPTLFYPLGSRPVTITIYPVPHLFLEYYTHNNPCEIFLRSCLKVYETGSACGRAYDEIYFTFDNYCTMELDNCKHKAKIWQIAYFGNCKVERIPDAMEEFNLEGDNFLEAAVINEPPFNPLTGRQEAF